MDGALKLITEAYKAVLEGNEQEKTIEEEVQNSGKEVMEQTTEVYMEEVGNMTPINKVITLSIIVQTKTLFTG